ncbi:MAG: redoxin family protein [Caldilineaceae bacterium]|nr:redoxin family protein [Caldilineaceae bacterium]
MMQFRTWLLTTMIGLLFLAACAAPATPERAMATPTLAATTEPMAGTHPMTGTILMTDTMLITGTMLMTETSMAEDGTALQAELPVWQTLALVNARTGKSFTLADFAGKTVFVETMATWCSNCRQQLSNVKAAVTAADASQVVFVAISVETDLSAETLASYAAEHGFDWTFAVATPELVQALAATFGQTIANPPATPHFLIYPDGSHGDLVTGFESGEQILANLAQS